MRRGRSHNGGSSLFAFQDVMASLIGILFFVVIFMAIDMVQQGVAAAADIQTDPNDEVAALQARLDQLHRQRQNVQQRVDALTNRLKLASTFSTIDLEQDIRDLNRRLLRLHQQIELTMAELEQSEQRLSLLREQVEESLQEYDTVMTDLLRRQQADEDARSLATVLYVIGEAGSKEPWLVEVSAGAIRVAGVDGRTSRLDFTAPQSEKRIRQFLSWAGSQSRGDCYFVMLIKPSGFANSQEIGEELGEMGFSIGIDLLPEDWQPFQD